MGAIVDKGVVVDANVLDFVKEQATATLRCSRETGVAGKVSRAVDNVVPNRDLFCFPIRSVT